MHIKNQVNEDRRIYVRVMFRLNENASRCMRLLQDLIKSFQIINKLR